ncbi:CGNR zinc finger domain-containing protein [Rhizobium sp. BK379]|jgi:predicted RNA-binding Zn ribbon-like protein|uniref:CGNR zinc finger domain-containing protein n=1 Tax=Rhizobium sp. BK379 TaxID=2587059 RepID=UPI000DD7D90B|nr:CGNR zinc finger domain-containing protein [Rhizobium sp. BK379]MBB3446463.1 putative RNA-binding Zn ribbon-like protein [Rhizobium sp. BK379]
MSFSWTPHRFSGGALALDVANSVILRHDTARSIDRFEAEGQMERFPAAARAFCAERVLFGDIAPVRAQNRANFIELREATDRYFRQRVLEGNDDRLLAELLETLARTLRGASEKGLDTAMAHSVLRLIAMPDPERMKICGNCGWLFIDRSKNKSRAWCDMAVCGNRAKAIRHYRRKKKEETP